EWASASRLPFGHGFISALNDGIRLYLLVDVLDDTVNDPPNGTAPSDYFWLTFDVNGNGQIDSRTDLTSTSVPRTYNMRYQYYTGPGSWTGLQSTTRSSLGPGFGCFFGDGTLSFLLNPLRINCSRHRVWEFGIDLREIGAQAGGTVHMGL